MRARTILSTCLVTLWICMIIPISARKPPPPDDFPDDNNTTTKTCKSISTSNNVINLNFVDVQLKYEPNDYPDSWIEFQTYHGISPFTLTNLITPTTERLDPAHRSFIRVYLQGTQCSGEVESTIYKAEQVTALNVFGVTSFSQEGGTVKDVKIIANSIQSNAGRRLVWTKVYSGAYMSVLSQFSQSNDKVKIESRAVVQYPYMDSLYLDDDSWINAPVYDDGDYVYIDGTGGGGGNIDPFPSDSLLL